MRATSKSSLFLTELIIAIFFFLLASVVCVQLFASAHLKSQESVYRNLAMLQAQTTAELFRNEKGDIDLVMTTINGKEKDGMYTCYFDSSGNFIDGNADIDSSEHFVMILTPSEIDRLSTLKISIKPPKSATDIFEMQTSIYNSHELKEE